MSLLRKRKMCVPPLPRWRVQVPVLREWQLPLPDKLPELRLLLMQKFLGCTLLFLAAQQLLAQESKENQVPIRPPVSVPT